MVSNYLDSVKKQFEYYKMLGDKTFEQLSDEQLFWKYNDESNSIASIIKHLHGNMLSRWTDFLTSDGEKEWRDREGEFENDVQNRETLLELWEKGWLCLFEALNTVNEDNFDQIIYIRNMGHSILEAINRQLAHYPYHIGQIVFIGKMINDNDWKSLSIPRGDSQQYNAQKFAQPKRRAHFTDEFTKKE
jgi:hypothetical protein